MGRPSTDRLLVLHALRIRGALDVDGICGLTGLDATAVNGELADATGAGEVVFEPGALGGHRLTPTGLEAVAAELADERRDEAVAAALEHAYERFGRLNGELLVICEDWQLREVDGERVINDHADPDHDRAVIDRLVELDRLVQPLCADLTAALERFGRYGPAFAHATQRLLAGDLDWLTRPLRPSYHTVWFELHEDLLASLGRRREDERRS